MIMCVIFECEIDIGVELQEVYQGFSYGGIVIFVCCIFCGFCFIVFFVLDIMQYVMVQKDFCWSWFYVLDVWGWKELCGCIEVCFMVWCMLCIGLKF